MVLFKYGTGGGTGGKSNINLAFRYAEEVVARAAATASTHPRPSQEEVARVEASAAALARKTRFKSTQHNKEVQSQEAHAHKTAISTEL